MKFFTIFLLGFVSLIPSLVSAQEKIGVLLMHGKQGGGARDSSLDSLYRKMQESGMVVIKPEMPWSLNRYIDGDWNLAMSEIHVHVQKLQEMGAAKIALVGHSLGSPAALSYAARYPDKVHALGLLAPGHVPYYYSSAYPTHLCGCVV